MSEQTLKLDDVTVDNGLNPRQGALDQEAVLEYSQHVEDLPPMVVYEVGESFLLVAGFHRYAAHRLAQVDEARFVVYEGDREAAAEYADLDNLRHGLRLSRAEKREVIARQLKRHPDWSDVRLASQCHTTDKTVRSVREQLEASSEIPRHDKLIGADGIERPRKAPPRPKAVAPPASPLPEPVAEAKKYKVSKPAPLSPPPPAPAKLPLPPPTITEPPVLISIRIEPGEVTGQRRTVISLSEDGAPGPMRVTTVGGLTTDLTELLDDYFNNLVDEQAEAEAEWLAA